MSKSHQGSLLKLANTVLPVDRNTLFLAHYDITENDILKGIAPIQNTTTLRAFGGKFGGGIAVEEGTVNHVANGDLKPESVVRNYNPAWDSSLNGSIYCSGWSSGYNSGVANPTVGYHAHINENRFGYPVMEFIDKNSQFSDTTYNLEHRWLGISKQISANVSSLGWTEGTKVSISFDMMVDHIDKGINFGLYHRNSANTGNTFAGASTTHYCTSGYEWQRKTVTYTLKATDWDFTQWCNIYIYGHYAKNSYEGIGWVRNIQVETKDYSTSFTDISRDYGVLNYGDASNFIDKSEHTISMWVNGGDGSFGGKEAWSMCFSLSPAFYFGWDNPSYYRVSLVDANGVQRIIQATSKTFIPRQWYMVSYTFDNGIVKLFVDGEKVAEGTIPTSTIEYQRSASETKSLYIGGYYGSNAYVFNGIIDEVRIDSIARTEEEIASWYISDNPFSPKGIYRIAY